jgi:hypothetical protein
LEAIEEEIYSTRLQFLEEDKANRDFLNGYICAVNIILLKAHGIYKNKTVENVLRLDFTSANTAEDILKKIKGI